MSTDHAARSVSQADGIAPNCAQALHSAAVGASHQCCFLACKLISTHFNIQTSTGCRLLQSVRMQAAAVISQNAGCCSHECCCSHESGCRLLQSLVRMQTAAVISQNAGCCSHKSECRLPQSLVRMQAAAVISQNAGCCTH